MKQYSLFRFIACIVALLTFTASYAQNSTPNVIFDQKAIVASVALSELKETNKKVYRDFTRSFKDAQDIRVSKSGGMTNIFCTIDGIVNRVRYDKKGNWHHTIRYYFEQQLPKDVRHLVKTKYYDYSIFNVVEVNIGDKTAHLVSIEDKTTWKVIKVVDGEMEIMNEFTKG